MSLPNISTPVRSSGRSCDTWSLEFTYSDGSGAVALDTNGADDGAWTDQDPRVTTPVADGGTGITSIRFPKCRRVRVLHMSIQVPTPGTSERVCRPGSISPSGGTMNFIMLDYAGALADPPTSARGRLVLQLEYN